MRIRLTGTRQEIHHVVMVIRAAVAVKEVSPFYPNRGTNSEVGRVYLKVSHEPRPYVTRFAGRVQIDDVDDRGRRSR